MTKNQRVARSSPRKDRAALSLMSDRETAGCVYAIDTNNFVVVVKQRQFPALNGFFVDS